MKHRKKNLKPIDYDVHFIYECTECQIKHWLSLKESQTPNFKIVCDCGSIYKPKPIEGIKIIYVQLQNKHPTQKVSSKKSIPANLKTNAAHILSQYGFSESEAISLIEKSFEETQEIDCVKLIKYCLSNFGSAAI
jgi:hypothetical protein